MRIDIYTKFVLTVIALCLIWLSAGGPATLPTARAQVSQPRIEGGERVIIAGWADEYGKIHSFPRDDANSLTGVPVAIVWNFVR